MTKLSELREAALRAERIRFNLRDRMLDERPMTGLDDPKYQNACRKAEKAWAAYEQAKKEMRNA
jgi:hypothetical protein